METKTTPTTINDFRSIIQLLYAQGLKQEAFLYEQEAVKKGHLNIGSCHTEEVLEQFITVDPDMIALKNDVRILQGVNHPVLIRGETGTGKEIIAQALHGSRGPIVDGQITKGRFVARNCPGLSTDLMFSEFFGHKKGAFTGAINDKVGAFQYAYKGTLFIDEVGDMPMSMQNMLLRSLQEKKITPVGSNEEIDIDCRIVCATNKNLESMVEDGTFRLDLLHRLNVFELHTKPLRDRKEDVEVLIKKWDKRGGFNIKYDYVNAKPKELTLLGNCRQLEALVTRWNVLGK